MIKISDVAVDNFSPKGLRNLGLEYTTLSEINPREIFVIAPLMVMMLWIGVWPAWILNVINHAVSMIF